MKNLSIIIIAMFCVSATSIAYYEIKKSSAEATQQQGIYVFTDCKPVSEYEYLGTVKKVGSWSNAYLEFKNGVIKKVKKEYPEANGVLVYPNDGIVGGFKADAILIK